MASFTPTKYAMLDLGRLTGREPDDPVVGDGDGSTLGELQAADDSDALEALHWAQLADEVAAADPEAWALGLAAIERPKGVNLSVLVRLRAA